MKYILSLLFTVIMSIQPVFAGDNYTQAADSAYTSDDFPRAIELYEAAIANDGSSSLLFYNLGNAYYRNGNFGKAIVNYERALKLDPTNQDAKINLAFVNSRIADKPSDNASLTEKVSERTITYIQADSWAWITLAAFACLIGLIAGYIFCSAVTVRKLCFFGGLVFIVLVIAGIIITLNAASRVTTSNQVIITSEAVHLGTSPRTPRNKNEQAFLLHEGTKLTVVDSLTVSTDSIPSKWYEVKVNSENRAWIKANDVEKI